ncbi:hypothetical protein Sgou_52540 [Streptomyces gougerotii]|uniref:Restriction endonuclease type IV Mrr domain-containing protein n=1 Tax=Streptomyces gougerotii TaxID=53448 RepID=A0ABQ1DDG6_9ACTN|nr:hypothetical protein Sgou_52540 [Streptomyces gougerotii]
MAAAGVAGALLWWLRRTDRLHRSGERRRREAEAVRAGQLSLAEVDALSWQEFERYVAGLCRRDGCRDVVVTGGSGDLGADVTATLPDGRRLVIQCKHYAPHRYVPSGDMQKFLGTALAPPPGRRRRLRRHLPVRQGGPSRSPPSTASSPSTATCSACGTPAPR